MLPSRYLNLPARCGVPAVEHGYATTAHLAQGLTVDRAFVLGSETVYREWGYVACSRARLGTRFYVVEPEVSDEHHTAAKPAEDRLAEVTRRLSRSEAQGLAIDGRPLSSDRRARAAKHARLEYVERALGPRPDSFRRRRRWDRAARRLERYRSLHAVHDDCLPLGPRPADRAGSAAWDRAHRELSKSRLALGLGRLEEADRGRGIEL